MKKIFILLLVSTQVHANSIRTYTDFEWAVILASNTNVVNIVSDTTVTGTWNLNNSILRISAKISGACTITNALIEANPYIQIFDTSVAIGSGCQIREFSVMWYGAVNGSTDSYYAIQKSIDQCKDRFDLLLPRNTYTISQPLLIANYNSSTGKYSQTSLRMYGQATMWDDGSGTKIVYTGNSDAIEIQLNKGGGISNLVIEGKWVSPGGTDSVYFNTTESNYVNQGTNGNGSGLRIDPFYDGTNSGSTGCTFSNLYIKNFQYLINISNSGGTQNGEIMTFRDIQLGDGKYGVTSHQTQEKMNTFTGLHSWGGLYTLFKISGANYYITNVNVAGYCVQLFDIAQTGWFPVSISNVYAEHFARIGSIQTYLPLSINNSLFDFAYQEQAGVQTLLSNSGNVVKFENCVLRYYGASSEVLNLGTATFDNCTFSGPFNCDNGVFINYYPKQMKVQGSVTPRDTTLVDTNLRIRLRNGK